jgi:hypothetical protein
LTPTPTAPAHPSIPPPRRELVAMVPVLIATWVYLPILQLNFYADDLHVLAHLRDGNLPYFLLRPFGGHNMVIRNSVFALSDWAFGPRPSCFYATVLVVHALNVWLFFRVLRNLGVGRAWACVGATLWGASPTHAGTLGWYSIFGQVLAATALLFVLDDVTRLAVTRGSLSRGRAACWWILLLAGSGCYGMGIGAAILFPAALFLLLPAAWQRRGVRLAFLALPVAVLAALIACRRLAEHLAPLPTDELLLVPVAVGSYAPILQMFAHLLIFSSASVALGSFGPPDYPDGVAVVAAGIYAAIVAVGFWGAPTADRRRMLALAALALGIYAVIALGRANAGLVFFAMAPARTAATLRYHYVGMLAAIALLFLALRQIAERGWLRRIPSVGAKLTASSVLAFGLFRYGVPIDRHTDSGRYVADSLASINRESGGHGSESIVLENGVAPRSVLGPGLPPSAFPGRAAVYLVFGPPDGVADRPIRFIERGPAVIETYRAIPGSKLGLLLESADEASASESTPAPAATGKNVRASLH